MCVERERIREEGLMVRSRLYLLGIRLIYEEGRSRMRDWKMRLHR